MLDTIRDGLEDLIDTVRDAFDDYPWLRAVAVVAVLAVVGVIGLNLAKTTNASAEDAVPGPAPHLVYTAPTANDAAVQLPQGTRDKLMTVGMQHGSVNLTRVESTGETSTDSIDLTPRVDPDDSESPILKVPDRAREAVAAKIAGIEAQINATPAKTGNRALYAGLTKVDLTDQDVTIISSGLDLAAPVDFRKLNWITDPAKVVSTTNAAGEQPALQGSSVTFVAVPAAGAQGQLRQHHKDYRNKLWGLLLSSAGASKVSFIDAIGSKPTAKTPAPPVDVPDLPGTPIPAKKDPVNPKRTICALPGSTYFLPDTATLVDAAKTQHDLAPCIAKALAANAAYKVDGWTAYDGPLTAAGEPAVDSSQNRALSLQRANAIVAILVGQLGVPQNRITAVTGHGNTDQPNPDPRSPENRLVVVSYVTA